MARYHDIAFDSDAQAPRYSLNEPRRQLAERLDGSYVLKSDRTDLGAEEAWRIYHLLTRAENALRCMKSPLAERPIFHQVQRRAETHIFLCVLACHLLVALEKTLLGQGVHTSWASVRDAARTPVLRARAAPKPRSSCRTTFTSSSVSRGRSNASGEPSSTTTTSKSSRGYVWPSSAASVRPSSSGCA